MKLLLTGASGYVGGFILNEARQAGDDVICLTRHTMDRGQAWIPFDLNHPPALLPRADALIHTAFDHLPGRYRGGEGGDAAGFLRRNRDGSRRLFDAAEAAGILRVIFLSSRAVYGDYPAGTCLSEALPPRPDTLYGQMKLEVEQDLATRAGRNFCPVSLRATGIYGQSTPGGAHKWAGLFADFEAGTLIESRRATEVLGQDLAQAVRICLIAASAEVSGSSLNVSDLLLDRRDLLSRYANLTGASGHLPACADAQDPNVMDCARLQSLGWTPSGFDGLDAFLKNLAAEPLSLRRREIP